MPSTSSFAISFGEILVDIIWSADAELEEILLDAKAALAQCADQNKANERTENDDMSFLTAMTKAKQDAELDKDTLIDLVKQFMVHHSKPRCAI